MKQVKQLISSLALILAIVLLVSGCTGDAPMLMDKGADNFANGKFEEDYFFTGSDKILDDLIDKYSGSYYQPTGTGMTDDEYEDAEQDAEEDDSNETGENETVIPPKKVVCEVSNYDELVEAFHKAYASTSLYLEFTLKNGYSVDLATALEDVYRDIQRKDPINACGVESWTWGNQLNKFLVKINYQFTREELIRIKEETPRLVTAAADEIRKKGTTDYELICAVNKYLCDKVVYPSSEPYAPMTHTAYGALKDGLAVCEGYTCAAKLILEELGIKCDIQVGVCSNNEGHAWNLVYLEGNWYQMDITWNDGGANITDYLLVTDDFMRKSRTWDTADYPKTPTTPYKAA